MLHTSLVRWETKRNKYWDDCIHEISVAQNIQIFSCFPSWSYFLESECRGSILTHLFRDTNVNAKTHRSCFISKEVLDQEWRDSIPGKRCCQYLDLHFLNYWFGEKPSTTITSSLCSVKLPRTRCRTVLINVWAVHDGSASAVYTSQCIRHHYVFIGTMRVDSFATLQAINNWFGSIAIVL